jgi:glycosyltransferase involved in cell wall biosynthesis
MNDFPKIKFQNFLPENPYRLNKGGNRFKGGFKENPKEIPLVTIITVVLNGEKHLKDSINSVACQDYSNIEYIIIDGGSQDNTLNIIKEYENLIDIWYSEPDLGIYDAFNKGISLARGEIIGFINSDDWYNPNIIGHVVDILKKEEFDMFCGKLAFWKEEKELYRFQSNPQKMSSLMSIPHQTVFLKKDLHIQWGGYSNNFKIASDYHFLLNLSKSGCKIRISDKIIANMRFGGVSSINLMQANVEFLKIKNLFYPKRKIYNYIFFLKSCFKFKMKLLLENLGLKEIIRFYRKYIIPFFRGDVTYN